MNEAKHLVKVLFSKLTIIEHQVEVIKMSITLLLYALCKMDCLGTQSESDILDIFGMCEVALEGWIKRREVMGGRYFGYKTQDRMTLLYGRTELKVRIFYTV